MADLISRPARMEDGAKHTARRNRRGARRRPGARRIFFERLEPRLVLASPVVSYSTYLGGSRNEFASDVAVDSHGNAWMIGTTQSADLTGDTPDSGTGRGLLTKFSPQGLAESAIVGAYPQFDSNGYGETFGHAVEIGPNDEPLIVFETFEAETIELQAGGFLPLTGTHLLHVAKLNDRAGPLFDTILPVLIRPGLYAPYGFSGVHLATDAAGASYVTYSAFLPTNGGGVAVDSFLTKVSPAGEIVFTERLFDTADDVAVDSNKNIYIAMSTVNADLPTTNGAYQADADISIGRGLTDIWIARLDPAGSDLLGATYLGGSHHDTVHAIAVDPTGPGLVYVVGSTESEDFPLRNPIHALPVRDQALGSNSLQNAFATLIDLNETEDKPLMELVASTYLGGGRSDYLSDVAVDFAGNVYVVGGTNSLDFPTANAIQSGWARGPLFDKLGGKIGITTAAQDLVLAKLNPTLTTLDFSTYYGGSGHDFGPTVAVDSAGNIHVAATSSGEVFSPLICRDLANSATCEAPQTEAKHFVDTADFPVVNPHQRLFGGGDIPPIGNVATDAVVLQFAQRGTLQGRGPSVSQRREFHDIVAQFNSPRGNASPSQFTATIDWGDGTTSNGNVTRPNPANSLFLVYGTHQYDLPGAYPVVVRVEDRVAADISPIRNINLSRRDKSQSGGSIAVDRTDPNRLFAAMSDEKAFTDSNSLTDGGIIVATSRDGGSTWSPRPFGTANDPPVFLAAHKPDVLFDDFGNVFLAYVAGSGNAIVITWSTDGGLTFKEENVQALFGPSSGSPGEITLGSPKLAFGGPNNEIWVTFEDQPTNQVFAAGAKVNGLGNVGGFQQMAVLSQPGRESDIAVGPNGAVAVVWGNIPADGNTDGIRSSFDPDGLGAAGFVPATVVDTTTTNGTLATPAQQSAINLGATLAWDNSDGPHRGRLYAAFVDMAEDLLNPDNTVPTLFISLTDDNGITWTDPRRVSQDPQFQSMFYPSIALDKRNGTVAVGWYGTRGAAGTTATTADFFVATSADGKKLSEAQRVSINSSNALHASLTPFAREIGYDESPTMTFWNGRLFPAWSDNSSLDGENHDPSQFEFATTSVGVINVKVPPVAIRPLPIQAVAGQAFDGPVATFTHPSGGLKPQDFVATIHWGDGGQSAGQVSQPGGLGTEFIVSGSHLYSETGAFPLWISVLDQLNGLTATPVSNVNAQQGSQAEATIAIDPTNPNRVFAAGVHVNVQAPRGIPIGVSSDGGVTWSSKTIADGTDFLPPSIGDPKAVFDEFGNLFLTYLTPDPDRHTVVLLSTNGGRDFTTLRKFTDLDKSDQPSIAIGPGENGEGGSVWVTWERGDQQPFAKIMAAGAPVFGLGMVGSFNPVLVAPQVGDGLYRNFGDIAVGPAGQVLVTYVKDVPGGTEVGPAELVTHLDPDGFGPEPFGPPVLASDVKIGRNLQIPAQETRTIDTEGNLAWDRSGGAHHGRAYLVYTDSPAVGSADTNIFIRYSDSNGASWSEPIQIHDDDPQSQFLPSVAVDQSSGNVGVGWHTNVATSNVLTRFTATISDDGGSTFRLAYLVSPGESDATDITIDPGGKRFQYGDYTGMAFAGGVMQPIWGDNSVELEAIPDPRRFDLASARVAVAQVSRLPLVVQDFDLDGFEGAEFTARLTRFTDPNGANPLAAYSASINWGDDSEDGIGTIVQQPDGSFEVFGTHEYKKLGSYTISVRIKGPATKGVGTVTAAIANAPLDLFVLEQRVVRQTEFTQVVALLEDLNPHSVASDFLVTIEWGDGGVSPAVLELQAGSGENGAPNYFNVTGTHKYLSEQSYTIHVSLLERATGQTLSRQGILTSGDPPLTVDPGQFLDIEALAGINTGDLVLVTFVRAEGSEAPLDTGANSYIATINWGDGTVDANIRPFVTADDVTVVGRHTYLAAGQYFPFISLRDDSGGFFGASLIAMVEPDVTSQVRAIGSGLVYNPVADRYVGELTITNVTQSDIDGPLFVVVHDLPAGVELKSFTDISGEGDPLFKVNQSRFSAGTSLPIIPLEFRNPGNVPITYRVQVFDGLRMQPPSGAGLVFEPNLGQAGESVSYVSRGADYAIGLAADHVAIVLGGESEGAGSAAYMQWLGGKPSPPVVPRDPLPGVSNYLLGDDSISNVPHYARVRYSSVYDGIDLEYYGREGALEYDWIVRPGADVADIAMRFGGVDRLVMDGSGNLRLAINGGELVQLAPVAYQFISGQRQDTSASFVLQPDGTVTYAIGNYDPSLPLVIDPVLVYATYLGGSPVVGSLGDVPNAVTVDSQGNSYVVGRTQSLDFPTVNAIDDDLNDQSVFPAFVDRDAFVTKLDPSGVPVFSTYLGGALGTVSFGTEGFAIAVNDAGRIWLGGQTNSPTFPAPDPTPVAVDFFPVPEFAAFLTQLSPDGSAILYSTLFSGGNRINDLALDDAGVVYAVGTSGTAVFGLRFDASGVASPWARKLSDGTGMPRGIALDAVGQIYIAGFTNSPNFTTKNALIPVLPTPPLLPGQTPEDRNASGFVMKLSNAGDLLFSTYLGGSIGDSIADIAVDNAGVIYLGGLSFSSDLPVPGGLDTTFSGSADGFLIKLANDGSAVLYGTYIGGGGGDVNARESVTGVAVDARGRVYLSGIAASADLPVVRAHQPTGFTNSSTDGFAASLSADGLSYEYLTYWGGTALDELLGVAVDAKGNATYIGRTNSTDLPTRNPWQPGLGGDDNFPGLDAFVLRLLTGDAGAISLHNSPFTATEGTPFSGLVAFFESNGTETANQFSAVIDWGDGLTSAGTIAGNFRTGFQVFGTHLYRNVGAHDIYVTVRDSLNRIVTVTNTVVTAGPQASARYRVAIDTSALAGLQAQLGLQFNPGALPGSPDVRARVTDLNLSGGSLGTNVTQGDVSGTLGNELTIRPTAVRNRLIQNVTLGSQIEFELELSGPGLSPAAQVKFANVFALQLLNSSGSASLLASDSTGSVLRVIQNPDGTTKALSAGPFVGASAAGVVTIANGPIQLELSPFEIQEGRPFNLPVATFTSGNPLEGAGDFTAMIDWGDGVVSSGAVTGGNGSFTVVGSHVYEQAGAYSLAVTVTDPDGLAVTAKGGKAVLAANQFNSFTTSSIDAPPVIGDFNGDGILDVVNAATNTFSPVTTGAGVQIVLGRGDGTFNLGGFQATNDRVGQMAVGDFNEDGKLDVAAALNTFGQSTAVRLFLGNGDGTVQPAITLTNLANPGALAAADFNRDGDLDLIYTEFVPNQGTVSNQLRVALGNGNGTFDSPMSTSIPGAIHLVYTADINGDSTPDALLASSVSGLGTTLNFLRGVGDGTFVPAVAIFNAPGISRTLAIGDLNDDDRPDIAYAHPSVGFLNNTVSVLINDGIGAFATAAQLASPTVAAVVIGDFDRDGLNDVATAEPGSGGDLGRVRVFLNEEEGAFAAGVSHAGVALPSSLLTGDFDRDGNMDLASSGNATVISVLFGIGDGTFASAVRYPVGLDGPRFAMAADVNGDTRTDAVILTTSGRIVTELSGGNGTFQPVVSGDAGGAALFPILADVNGDSVLDMVHVTRGSSLNDPSGISVVLGANDGTFPTSQVNLLGPRPETVKLVDLNGDGRLDVVTANPTPGNVSIFLATTNGTFQSAMNVATTNGARSIAFGLFNADANIDLAVVSEGGNVSILLGNGNGTFAPAVNLAVGSSPQAVQVGDFNRDSKVDLVIVNLSAAGRILPGNGDGTFGAEIPFTLTGNGVREVAVGNLNGDNNLDIVAAHDVGGLSVLLGNGDGSFQPAVNRPAGTTTNAVTLGDFNGDTRLDIAATNLSSNNVSILLGNADGTFQNAVHFGVGGIRPRSVTTGDFNGDGKLDLAVANQFDDTAVLLGNGNGAFQTPLNYASGTNNGAGVLRPRAVAVGDINGDGKADLAIAHDINGVTLIMGRGDGTFPARLFTYLPPTGVEAVPAPRHIAAGDINGDGKMDLAAAFFGIVTLIGNGNGNFQAPVQLLPSGATGLSQSSDRVQLADMDGDGDRDLVSLHAKPGVGGGVAVWRNNGNGTFATPLLRDVPLPDYSRGVDMNVGDVNGDGRRDVVVSDVGSGDLAQPGGVSVMRGVGDGSLTAPVRLVTASRMRPYQVMLADMSRDGRPEIIAIVSGNGFDNEARSGVAIFTNDGSGNFGPATFFDHGGNVANFSVTGDFNGDGSADVLVPHSFSGNSFSVIYAGKAGVRATDAPVTVTGANINPRVNASFTAVVATFIDDNPFGQAGDFTAMINWGDGQTTAGTVSARPLGGFAVTGTHAYASTGSFTTSITVTETGQGMHIGSGLARVSAADQALTATGLTFNAMAAIPFTGVVATFTDADPNGSVSDFSAVIRWGDGQMTAGVVSAQAGGGFRVTGTHTYPNPGTIPVVVEITDIGGSTAAANSTAQVAPRVNQSPVAKDDSYTTREDETLEVTVLRSVLANDNDFDGDTLHVEVVSPPVSGQFTPTDLGSFSYKPAADFTGTVSFTYLANDDNADSNVATVTITILPVNDPPEAIDNSAETNEDTPVVVNILGNDIPGDGALISSAVSFTKQPEHGTVRTDPATGMVTYSPFTNYFGPDSFKYRVLDANGLLSNEASVAISVRPVNDPPVAVPESYVTTEEATLVIGRAQGVLANDLDADANTLTVSDIVQPGHGTLLLNDDGSFTYTPSKDFSGIDRFQYRASDSINPSTAVSVSLFVASVNDAPEILPLADQAIDEGGSLIVSGSFTDADPDDSWTATVNYGDGTGNLPLTLTGKAFALNHLFRSSGSFVVTVKVTDQAGGTGLRTFPVVVRNLAPTVQAGADKAATEGAAVSIVANFADLDIADSHTAQIDWGDGSLVQVALVSQTNGAGTAAASHVYADEGSFTVTVTVEDDEGASNSDALTVTVSNAAPFVAAGADLTIDTGDIVELPALVIANVIAENIVPLARQAVAGSFFDAGALDRHIATIDWGDGTVETVTLEERTTRSQGIAVGVSGVVFGVHDYDEVGTYTVRLTVQDEEGSEGFDTFQVNVIEINDAPRFLAGPDQTVTDESGPQSVAWATAVSPGAAAETQQTLTFAVTADNTSLFTVQPAVSAAGLLTFTPAPNVRGTAVVTVKLKDTGGTAHGGIDESDSQTFEIRVFKPFPKHNAVKAEDVINDGFRVPEDALTIINFINTFGAQEIPLDAPIGPIYYDTTRDNFIAAEDALLIINYINTFGPEGEPEPDGPGPSREDGLPNNELIELLALDIATQPKRRR